MAEEIFGGAIRLSDHVTGVLKQAAAASRSFSAEVKKARSHLEELDKKKLKEKQLRIKNSQAFQAIEGVKNRLKPLKDKLVHVKAREEHAMAKIRKVKDALAGVKEHKIIQFAARGASGVMKAAGKIALAGTAAAFTAAAAAGGVAVHQAADFQSEMANVATLLDGEVNAKIASMGSQVKKISVDTGISAHNLSSGLYEVVSAFGESADSSRQLEIAAKAAKAGNAETADSVKMLAAITKGYGDTSAAAVQKASDLAFVTVKLGQTSFPELASSMGQVVPLAAAMKVSQEELFGAMATLTGVTGGTAEVTTQLKAVMQGFMSPSKEMASALHKIGYSSGAAALESESLGSILNQLKESVNGDEVAFASLFSSVEAKNAVLALAGTQAENFTAKTEAMKSATGAADEAFQRQTSSVKEMAARIKNHGMVILMSMGEKALPVLESGLKKVSDFMPRFEKSLSGAMKIIGPFFSSASAEADHLWSSWKPAFDSLGPTVSSTIESVSGTIQTAIPVVSAIFSSLGSVAQAVLPTIGEIVHSMSEKASRAFEIMGNHTGTFQNILSAAGPAISSVLSTAWSVIGPILDLAVEGFHLVASVAGYAFPYIQGVITSVWGAIEPVLHAIGAGIEAVAGVFQKAAAAIGGSAAQVSVSASKIAASSAAARPSREGRREMPSLSARMSGASSIGANANGTSFWRGGYTTVGEHGPELVNLPTGAKVYSNSQTSHILNRWREAAETMEGSVVQAKTSASKSAVSAAAGRSGEGRREMPFLSAGMPGAFRIGSNANGTSFWRGGYTTVGEHGRELVDLPTGTKGHFNPQTSQVANRGREVHVHIQQVVVREEADVRKIAEEIVKKLEEVDR